MKAARIYGTKDVRIENIDMPTVKANQVKMDVAWTGICGSDLHAYFHGVGISETPHPVSGRGTPLTLGHEFSGTITEVGEEVTSVKVGDRVTVEPLIYSEDDYFVKQGKYNLADDAGFIGLNDDGGFAEVAVVDASKVHVLPEGVSLEEGALMEPTAVAFQSVKASNFKVGNSAIVFGAGPIGLLTIISLKAAGATSIVAVDISNERLEKALEVGASVVINSLNESVEEKVASLYERGIDFAFEAAGAQATFTSAMNVLKKGGQLMIISVFTQPVEVNALDIIIREISISGFLGYRHIFPEVIEMVASGQMDVKKVITKKITLDNLVTEGLEVLGTDKSQAKILVSPKPL